MYKVSQLYDYVKSLPRKDGGLNYTEQEKRDYTFQYTHTKVCAETHLSAQILILC